MIPGQVRNVRQLAGKVQADVSFGTTTNGSYCWLKIETNSEPVREALSALHRALADEADRIVRDAQKDAQKRGQRVMGGGA